MNLTTEPLTKPDPLIVRVKAAEPTATLAGCKVVIAGTGLFAAVIVKVTAFEVPPPGAGFVTETAGVPVAATSAASIAAVSFVALTKVVTRATPLN